MAASGWFSLRYWLPRLKRSNAPSLPACSNCSRLSVSVLISRSQLDTGAQLDHAIGRDLEKHRGARGVARHRSEQLFTPQRHARGLRWHEGLTAQEERGFHHVELEPLGGRELECARQVRLILEAIVHHQSIELFA